MPGGEIVDYRSHDDDNARWSGFPFRGGDIVVSTRSKCGTTWMQMICLLLVHQRPDLPAPLSELSPWLDWTGAPIEDVVRRLATQDDRRVIKTHTPLDGLPLDPRATFVVVARDPLDMAVSLYHHADNLDRDRIEQLTGNPTPPGLRKRPPLHDWLLAWTEWNGKLVERLDSLPGVIHHVADAWSRRETPNVVLTHYDDLSNDLDGEMRRLADRLGIAVDEERWPSLVAAAGFDEMRAKAPLLAPPPPGVLKDDARFFRQGRSGEGRTILSHADLEAYLARTSELAPPDVLGWLLRGY
jgi:hypothetical protein